MNGTSSSGGYKIQSGDSTGPIALVMGTSKPEGFAKPNGPTLSPMTGIEEKRGMRLLSVNMPTIELPEIVQTESLQLPSKNSIGDGTFVPLAEHQENSKANRLPVTPSVSFYSVRNSTELCGRSSETAKAHRG
eukprot:TRINITY_DN4537_c0_g1_i1.p1 TRINITY_DN4537_c0_g1~~TRINITY_DN4537_c0_g1_i1.p1  ORF type:complete len:133 (+),score=27.51 TRINITY_DN4537_c0_g1_i1:231-629(+)